MKDEKTVQIVIFWILACARMTRWVNLASRVYILVIPAIQCLSIVIPAKAGIQLSTLGKMTLQI
jgi:hypothetical protein